MPRHHHSDPLAAVIGYRIRQLREEAEMTLEQLAYDSEVAKGYLSDIENGRALPTVTTLHKIAQQLELLLLDLVTFPEEDIRQELTDLLRHLPPSRHRRLLDELSDE